MIPKIVMKDGHYYEGFLWRNGKQLGVDILSWHSGEGCFLDPGFVVNLPHKQDDPALKNCFEPNQEVG